MLEKTNRVNLLFDFYSSLLKERQKDLLDMYYREDLSLSEIAELTGVSRQAVYDLLKRTENTLEKYEEKLHLVAAYNQRERMLLELLASVKVEDWDRKAIQSLISDLVEFELERD